MRLRLEEQRPAEADALLVLGDQGQEAGELLLLARQVGVEERLVALAPAPQHVVRASQPMGCLEHVLHLGRGVGEDLGIGVGSRAGRVARMAEQVRGSPQQPGAGALHVALDGRDDGVEHRARLGEGAALRRNVAVVEGEERDAELGDELECRVELRPRRLHRIRTGAEPGTVERPGAEHVGSRPVERMPQADRDPQVVLHALAEDDAIRLVDLVGKWIVGREAAELDPIRHIREEACHAIVSVLHACPPVGPTLSDAPKRPRGSGWAKRTPGVPEVPW